MEQINLQWSLRMIRKMNDNEVIDMLYQDFTHSELSKSLKIAQKEEQHQFIQYIRKAMSKHISERIKKGAPKE